MRPLRQAPVKARTSEETNKNDLKRGRRYTWGPLDEEFREAQILHVVLEADYFDVQQAGRSVCAVDFE